MPPVNLLIKPVSSLCNMRCKYCFYTDVAQNREIMSYGMMRDETLEQIVQRTFEYATGFAGFAFQGGEPTLAGLSFYQKLIELQAKYNTKGLKIYNSIQTNGCGLNEEWAKFFAEQNFLVGLSLDGTKEFHDALRLDANGQGTYHRVVASAALLERFGVQFNILCVVNNFVAKHPRRVYHSLRKYKFLQFIPCIDGFAGGSKEYSLTNEHYGTFLKTVFDLYYRDLMAGNYVSIRNFDNYIRMLQGYPPESCGMNGFCTCYLVIEGDGSVFPCDFYVLDRWKLGNIQNASLPELLKSPTAVEFVEVSRYMAEKCKSCPHIRLCRGGCRRDREPFVDGQPGINRFCESYLTFFDYSTDRMVQLARMFGSGGK